MQAWFHPASQTAMPPGGRVLDISSPISSVASQLMFKLLPRSSCEYVFASCELCTKTLTVSFRVRILFHMCLKPAVISVAESCVPVLWCRPCSLLSLPPQRAAPGRCKMLSLPPHQLGTVFPPGFSEPCADLGESRLEYDVGIGREGVGTQSSLNDAVVWRRPHAAAQDCGMAAPHYGELALDSSFGDVRAAMEHGLLQFSQYPTSPHWLFAGCCSWVRTLPGLNLQGWLRSRDPELLRRLHDASCFLELNCASWWLVAALRQLDPFRLSYILFDEDSPALLLDVAEPSAVTVPHHRFGGVLNDVALAGHAFRRASPTPSCDCVGVRCGFRLWFCLCVPLRAARDGGH